MRRLRFLLVPCLSVVAILAYAAFVPSRGRAGQEPQPTAEAEASESPIDATVTATATSTAPAAPAPAVAGLPRGLSGRLTYRTEGEEVTVKFPSGAAIARGPMTTIVDSLPSADGLWSVTTDCTITCRVSLRDANGSEQNLDVPFIAGYRWSPEGHRLALAAGPSDGGYPGSNRLMLIDDRADAQPRVLYETRKGLAQPFEWLASGDLLIADNSDADARLVRVTSNGDATTIATVPSAVWYLYPSPDGKTVAFTQDAPDGWQLWTVNGETGEVRNAGNMGSDPAGVAPPQENAPVREKGPMYIAWSPDGTQIAFGGGYDPPYTMTIADLGTGAKVRTEFPDGYPGEIKWSPDGKKVAVSSYNLPRTHHEAYLVDPASGAARDVLSGCVIVWSPDSRFLAIHGEREPGVAIADVETLERGQLTHTPDDTPLLWEP